MEQSASCHSVCLVDRTHEFYRTWMRAQNLGRRFSRAKDPVAAEYNRELSKWEYALRRLLSVGVEFSSQRYLAYQCESHSRGAAAIRHCREIDFVVGSRENPRVFAEFKLRENSNPAKERGMTQLNKGLDLARERWFSLSGLLVSVAMGKVLRTEESYHPEAEILDIRQLREALAGLPPGTATALWVDGLDLANQAVSAGFLTEEDVSNLPSAREHTVDPFSRLQGEAVNVVVPSLGFALAGALHAASGLYQR